MGFEIDSIMSGSNPVCDSYCNEQVGLGYSEGLTAGLSQMNLVIVVLLLAVLVSYFSRQLRIRFEKKANKTIDMKSAIRYRNIVKVLDITSEATAICSIGCSLYLFLWSIGFTGLVMA